VTASDESGLHGMQTARLGLETPSAPRAREARPRKPEPGAILGVAIVARRPPVSSTVERPPGGRALIPGEKCLLLFGRDVRPKVSHTLRQQETVVLPGLVPDVGVD
jgi:hypothetical protein